MGFRTVTGQHQAALPYHPAGFIVEKTLFIIRSAFIFWHGYRLICTFSALIQHISKATGLHQRAPSAPDPLRGYGELIQIDGSQHDWNEELGPHCTLESKHFCAFVCIEVKFISFVSGGFVGGLLPVSPGSCQKRAPAV